MGAKVDKQDQEIIWYRSVLASLLVSAKAKMPNLTHDEIQKICEHALSKYPPP